jgi:hypothetical protein
MMTPEQERWAEAAMVQRLHGDGAQAHIADRIADLLRKGDQAGVGRWCEIGARVAELATPGTVQ